MTRAVLSLWLVLALAGCGGGARESFSQTFPDADEAGMRDLAARLAGAPPRDEVAVLAGVTSGASPMLFVWDLAQAHMRWQVSASPTSPPIVAGDTVITHEGPSIVLRDLADGRVRGQVPDEGLALVGADGEGRRAAFVLSTGGSMGARSRIVFVEDGGVRWSASSELPVGAPAVRGGLVLVPWARQNLSALDAVSGQERWRTRVTDDVIGHALVDGRDVYVGQAGLFRVTPSLANGSKAHAAYLALPTTDLPGHPAPMVDAYAPPPPITSALLHVRVAFRPGGEGETVSLGDGVLYFVFYKLVFALEPSGGAWKARWARELPADVVAARAVPGGLLVADEGGGLHALASEDGRETFAASLGVRPQAARFGGTSWPAITGTGDAAPPLRDQLLAAADSTDARLVPARIFAVQMLAGLDDPEVTANLVALCESTRAPPTVKQIACRSVSEHAGGRDAIRAALERHASFLQGTTAPPVGALASAAARLGERGAVPLLVAQLRDPATAEADLAPLALALKQLGDRAAAEPLVAFIRLYHAELHTDAGLAGMAAAIDALATLQGGAARELLEAVRDDGLAPQQTRARAADALDALAATNTAAHDAQTAADAPAGGTASGAPAGPDTRPTSLGAADLERALGAQRAAAIRCMSSDPQHPPSVRLVIAHDGGGHVTEVHASGAEACLTPLLMGLTLPSTRGTGRQQITYTLRR